MENSLSVENIKVGTIIDMGQGNTLKVFELKKTFCKCEFIDKSGKVRSRACLFSYNTLTNPHYNKNISLIN